MPVLRYIPRKISDVEKNDTRISVMGKVVEAKDSSFVLGDDTGKIEIFTQVEGTENPRNISVKEGAAVRAFCIVIGTQLKADAVQNLDGLDLEQFKKIEGLYNKAGV
jgi:hypothetical protein